MNRSCLVVMALLLTAAAGAGEMKEELDFAAKPKLLDVQFQRYPAPARAIQREPRGVRFYFDHDGTAQTGLASRFGLAGDFEISVGYEWTPVVLPKEGYGVRCGIAVEAGDQSISLVRGNLKKVGSAYVVNVGKKVGDQKKYTDQPAVPTSAKFGRLVIRREKGEVVCLTADDDAHADLTELCRLPFPTGTAQKVLLFADPGGVPGSLDARLVDVKIRSEEITSRLIAQRDMPSVWPYWAGAALLVAAIALGIYWRRREST